MSETVMTHPDPVAVAEGLTKRPRMTLLAWPGDGERQWTWFAAVKAAEDRGERRASYRHTIRPLEMRGLAVQAFGGSYNIETRVWKPKRYRLTPLGLAVRAVLLNANEERI